jgi:hypothetical protein
MGMCLQHFPDVTTCYEGIKDDADKKLEDGAW